MATREEVIDNLDEMVDDMKTTIREKAIRLLDSGAVDIVAYDGGHYELPKILLCAVLEDMSHQYRPFGESGRKLVKNLSRF